MKNCLFILMLFICKCAFSQSNDTSRYNRVIINEIFADPNPTVGLPPAEFIELWNTTNRSISLKNWTFNDAATSFKFKDDSIRANEYLLLCTRNDTALFKNYGRVIGLSPWPSLNNTSDNLVLKDQDELIVSEVSYKDTWYQDAVKKNGGFTLELIDPNAVCTGTKNWTGSNNPAGGTPGKQNSVYKLNANLTPLKITSARLLDSISVEVGFNRFTDSAMAADPKNYLVNNGVGNPILVYFTDDLTLRLKFSEGLTQGKLYRIIASNISDCSGAVILPEFGWAEFFVSKKITKGDLLISEILFNPKPGGVDFLEIYNNSNQVLDVQNLFISNLPFTDTLNRLHRLGGTETLLKNGDYLALTSDPDNIKDLYRTENPNALQKMKTFPAYNNDEGTVTLLSDNQMIDELSYTEKMHAPIIRNSEGISLERTSYKNPANEKGNFRSAAASVGFATPGYKNSQYADEAAGKDEFTLLFTTFSPDNDGKDDRMQIQYKLSQPGFIANITVYNSLGIVTRKLYQNITLGTQGQIEWDGKNESAELNPAGIYLLYAEIFNAEGVIKKFRRTVVLARDLN